MPQPYAEPYAEVYTKAYTKKHVEQDPIPNIEPYNQMPPWSQPDEPLSSLSRAWLPSLSQLFLPSSPSRTPVSLSTRPHAESHVEPHVRPHPEALYVEPDHAEPLCFDEYGRSCTLADLYKNVRPPTSSRISQPAEPRIRPRAKSHVDPYIEPDHVDLAPIELVPVEKFKPVRVLDLRKLWTVEALHFLMNINEKIMNCLLNNSFEVNVLFYVIVFFSEFRIFSDIWDEVMIDIKNALFHRYMSDVLIHIEDVEVWLLFFIS